VSTITEKKFNEKLLENENILLNEKILEPENELRQVKKQ
jgi:hypothetical protein